jgi:hypothetical protein
MPRSTSAATSQLGARDDVTDGHAQPPDDGQRRAPSPAPSLVDVPPAVAAASDLTGASRPRVVESARGARWLRPVESAQTNQERKRITRRLCNSVRLTCGGRSIEILPAPDRPRPPSGAAAC